MADTQLIFPDKPDVCANTFVIGAQKAGTTYLAALLDQSPEVCVSDPKEPQFFTSHYESGFDAYAAIFADPQAKIRLDASTTYSFLRPKADLDIPDAPGLAAPVPQRILAAAPDARFIYILRDPVKRAASAHRHNMRSQPQPTMPISLLRCLQENPMLAIASRYAAQIERWLEHVPRERFLFVDFQRLVSDTENVIAEVCDFLDVQPGEISLGQAERGKHSAYRDTGLGQAMRRAMRAMPGLSRSVKALVPANLKQRVFDPVMKAPSEIVFYDELETYAVFAEDSARTQALTGIAFHAQ
ncbi:MAG: sulfotransferase [Pseudomonadota bacterium]